MCGPSHGPHLCPKIAAYMRLPRHSVWIYCCGSDWKHHSDDASPSDSSPWTRQSLQYGTGTVPYSENTICLLGKTGLLSRESFRSPKGGNESPGKLEQSHARVLSSTHCFLVSPGYTTCQMKRSKDPEASSTRAGLFRQSWNVAQGRTLHSRSHASACWDRWYEQYRVS